MESLEKCSLHCWGPIVTGLLSYLIQVAICSCLYRPCHSTTAKNYKPALQAYYRGSGDVDSIGSRSLSLALLQRFGFRRFFFPSSNVELRVTGSLDLAVDEGAWSKRKWRERAAFDR